MSLGEANQAEVELLQRRLVEGVASSAAQQENAEQLQQVAGLPQNPSSYSSNSSRGQPRRRTDESRATGLGSWRVRNPRPNA